MFQSRCSNSEFKSCALVRFSHQTVDNTTGERVTTTYTVDNRIDIITFGSIEFFAIVDHSFPAIVSSRERFAQCRNNIFESEFFHHLLEDTFVAFSICVACFNVSIRFEAQTQFRIFFVTDTYIYILHQRFHDRLCFFFCPQFLTEIQVNRYSYAMTLGCFASQTSQFGSFVRNSRSDTGPVEPVSTFHNSIKIKVGSISFSDSRMSTVIDNLAGTHRSACFQIVDTYAVATTSNKVCLYTIFTQCVYSRLSDFMFRQFGYEIGFMSVVGTAYCNVRFSTTIYYIKRVRLNKAGITRS